MVFTPLTNFCHSLVTIKNSVYSYPLLYLHKKARKNILKLLDDFLMLCFTAALVLPFSRDFQTSHTMSGSPFGAPPCSPEHLPGPVHHGLSDAGRDINNKSWSRNHSQEHKREMEGRHRPQLALLQVSSFDTDLMAVWWVHMGRHGFMHTCLHSCLHNIYGVYA